LDGLKRDGSLESVLCVVVGVAVSVCWSSVSSVCDYF
jgi:hypothetical protein